MSSCIDLCIKKICDLRKHQAKFHMTYSQKNKFSKFLSEHFLMEIIILMKSKCNYKFSIVNFIILF